MKKFSVTTLLLISLVLSLVVFEIADATAPVSAPAKAPLQAPPGGIFISFIYLLIILTFLHIIF